MNLAEKVNNLDSTKSLVNQLANSGNLSTSLKNAINTNNVRLLPTSVRIRKNVGQASGEIELLTANQDELVGVSDFQGKRLPDGEALIVFGSSVRFADSANPAVAKYKTSAPKEAHGAIVKTISNGKIITKDSVRDFETVNGVAALGDDILEYPIPRFYGDGKDFQVKMEFPDGVTLPKGANGNCFEVALYGFITQYK